MQSTTIVAISNTIMSTKCFARWTDTLICSWFAVHQAEMSIAKRLIKGRYKVTKARVEPEISHLTILVTVKTAP